VEVLISFIAIAGVLLIFSLDVRYRLGIALIVLSVLIQTGGCCRGKGKDFSGANTKDYRRVLPSKRRPQF